MRPVVDHQRRRRRRRRCPGSSARSRRDTSSNTGGGVEPIPSRPRRARGGRARRPRFAVSEVQPITTVTRPATCVDRASRRRGGAPRATARTTRPIVPLTKMPCIPSPTYQSSSARSDLGSTAPSGGERGGASGPVAVPGDVVSVHGLPPQGGRWRGDAAVDGERGRDRVSPVAIVSASSRAISGLEREAGRRDQRVVARAAARDSPTIGARSSVNAITPDQVRTIRTSASSGSTRAATATLPAVLSQRGRVAARRRLGSRRPAAADDEGVVRRLLQRQPPADVLHHRPEHVLPGLGHVEVQALGADRQRQAGRAPRARSPRRRRR